MIYPKPDSIYLKGTIGGHNQQVNNGGELGLLHGI